MQNRISNGKDFRYIFVGFPQTQLPSTLENSELHLCLFANIEVLIIFYHKYKNIKMCMHSFIVLKAVKHKYNTIKF